ncbi:MAG: LPS assembly protein LptD [Proteobacteria bacterium]|nr:LPS assembly protein LptD [Pseudomonadota bacterium]
MRHGPPPAHGKLRFFYGAAAFAMLAGVGATEARAQDFSKFRVLPPEPGGGSACQNVLCREVPPLTTTTPEGPEGDDGLGPNGIYLEADQVIDDNGVRTATGAVEARYQGRTVRANEVVYNTRTRVVTARGDARIINQDGSVQYADEVQLDEDFSAGVALGFATRLPSPRGGTNAKIAAASAVRRSPTITELNRAVYTPCNLCTDNGRNKTPTFSVRAERITQNRNLQAIFYRNAALQIAGVPVLYAPYFAHPDPQAVRASGFLAPEFNISDRRGFTYEQPYVYVISPSADVVVSPQINTAVNPFLNLQYRQRFYSGAIDVRLGYTYERDFNDEGRFDGSRDFNGDGRPDFSDLTHRSYILARGAFSFTPQWRWGFSAERTSDDLIFDKYSIDDVYETRGLYEPDNRRLLSQLYTQHQTERSYVSAAVLSFQGLRFEDRNEFFPLVAPLVEARYEPDDPVLGGRLRARGSAVALQRSEGRPRTERFDALAEASRRATAEVDWRRSFTLPSGVRIEPFSTARADAYSFEDATGGSGGKTRGYFTAGVDLSMPFIRPLRTGSVVLEPMAQLVASNESDRDETVPNEDSISFEFDETNLFEPNRFPGFDRFEGGLRLNAGLRATYDIGAGRGGSLLVGRSFRTEEDPVFPERVGLREKASDWVVAAQLNPGYGLSFFNRSRLDTDTLELQRSETRASYANQRVFFAVAHLKDVLDNRGTTRDELDFFADARVTKRIGVLAAGNASRDPVRDEYIFRRRDAGVYYQDECLRFEVIYQRGERDPRLGPDESIGVRLILATLGDTAVRGQEDR